MAPDDGTCPLCSGDLIGPMEVTVCRSCHSALQLGGALPVSTTGEFSAVPATFATRILTGGELGPMAQSAEAHCAWCAKAPPEVRRLLGRGTAVVCNQCIALCVDVLETELGDDWK